MNTLTRSENHRQTVVTVNFVLQTHFSLLAFTAAADALTTANLVTGKTRFAFRTCAVHQHHVLSDLGIHIPVDVTIDEHQLHLPHDERTYGATLVCGGHRCQLTSNPLMHEWLQHQDQLKIPLGGIWNGIITVAQAGLMDGFSCALHPDSRQRVRLEHPELELLTDTLAIDRNRLSAAGPNSAFELMLLLVRRHDSAATVQKIRHVLKADTSPFRHISSPSVNDRLPPTLHSAIQLMRSNLDEPVSKQHLAEHMNLSIRAMERLFFRHLNCSPARFYLRLRLRRAHELLSNSDLLISEVSDACGFISTAHFSRSFSRRYGLAPSDVRRAVTALLDA